MLLEWNVERSLTGGWIRGSSGGQKFDIVGKCLSQNTFIAVTKCVFSPGMVVESPFARVYLSTPEKPTRKRIGPFLVSI